MVDENPDNRADDTADARIDNRKSKQPEGNEHTPEVNVSKQRSRRTGGAIIGIVAIAVTVYLYINDLQFEILRQEATIEILRSENKKLWTQSEKESEPPDVELIKPGSSPKVEIEIEFTDLPPEGGGPSSRGDIGGRIDNLPEPQQYKIVLYALTDHWYVQPTEVEFFTDIDEEGQWSNWTHLGRSYAALLVLPSYKPDFATEELPRIGAGVLSKVTAPAK